MAATPTRQTAPPRIGAIRKAATNLVGGIRDLGVAEKIYGIVALLVIVTTLLGVMSVQSLRLQTAYRQLLATSAAAAINIERVNGLIYAIVMESRGIYMSTDRTTVKEYSDELLKRNRELAGTIAEWEKTVGFDDAEEFSVFKRRVTQFMEFRKDLARRAVQVSPGAARELGDNDDNRALRSELNADLEGLARIYAERAGEVAELGDKTWLASWYLALLGVAGVLCGALNVVVMRRFVIAPLSEITEATDQIVAGKIDVSIPYIERKDEIGRLARAVENFRDSMSRNIELQQRERNTAKQRDAVIEQRDRMDEKYLVSKWQLSAAINSIPQGVIMLDGAAEVLVINDQYRKIYGLPSDIKAGSSLEQILQHGVQSGLLTGSARKYLAAIVARIAKRQPSSDEMVLGDSRVISVQERPVDGGGWLIIHDDVTGQRLGQRILQRTEQFLVTIIENISEGIIAKDARNLRYVFVNRAAEKMMGMSRADIVGKTARQLLPAESAELIERRDRQLLAQHQQPEAIIDTVAGPDQVRHTVAVRRLQIGGADHDSHLLVSMIEDRTYVANAAEVAA